MIRFVVVLGMAACQSGPEVTERAETTTTPTAGTDLVPPFTSDDAGVDPSDVLFDRGRVFDVRIELDPSDWDVLRLQARSYASLLAGEDCLAEPFEDPYTWFPAAVEIDGFAYDLVGVRKKGLIGSASTTKPGLKIDLDEYTEQPDLLGLDRFTLNNSVQDPSLVRQCAAYRVFEQAGVPAPRCGFAHVWVNGDDLGVYVHVEQVDHDFLEARFGEAGGSLYEGTLSDFREGWTGTFDPKTDTTDEDLGPIHDLVDALAAPDADLAAALDGVLDVDAFLTFWAAEVLAVHWDGYAGNTNNFFVYAPQSDGRLRFVPWGTDGAWVSWAEPDGVYATGALARRLYLHPEFQAMYLDRVRHVLDTAWDVDAALADLDQMEAALRPEVPGGEAELGAAIDDVRGVMSDRRARIEEELGMAWTTGLRGSPCLAEVGEVSAALVTTWGTLETSPDPFHEGSVELDLSWGGVAVGFESAGALAGYSYGTPLVAAAVELPDGSYVLPYAWWFQPEDAAPGVTLPLDGARADGAVLYTDASLGWAWTTVGYLTGGSVTFTSIGLDPGDPVEATLVAPILGFP